MKTVVVLGMHRSATSLIAKALHDNSVSMGEVVLGASKSNPWGHFEDLHFIRLNDKILRAAGGTWDSPPPESAILEQRKRFEPEIKAIISAREDELHKDYPLWGFKDPRTTLTIRLFHPHLTNPHYIACYRDPHDVAESLRKRDGMPINKGLALAKEYNQRLARFMEYFCGEYNQ